MTQAVKRGTQGPEKTVGGCVASGDEIRIPLFRLNTAHLGDVIAPGRDVTSVSCRLSTSAVVDTRRTAAAAAGRHQ